jgi:glycosyltransferase involved in cell wall biosynthesis
LCETWTGPASSPAASTARLTDRIALTGELNDAQVQALYTQADLFVLPSLYEGYGMVFAEALRCGLPILATRAGAIADLVPASAGLLVESGDAEALAAATARMVREPTLLRELADGAWAVGGKLPGWDETARRVASALGRL